MNMRFWGGWFLVIAGISIMLTMGCEKGSLGVKPALVTGRVVDQDSGNGIANATIRMMSKEKFGTGEVKQGNNFATTLSNANGNFVFENVAPDNVVFEYFANNFMQAIYPQKTATTDDQGNESEIAEVESVYVKSGSVLNLGDLKLKALETTPLAATMTARIDLVDNTTKKQIDGNLEFTISFNGVPYRKTAAEWRATGALDLPTARTVKVMVRHEPINSADFMLYVSKTTDYSVTGDLIEIIALDPVTYNLQLRCVNVPDYIRGGVVNVFAEKNDGIAPPQILAQQAINNLGTLGTPNLPTLIEVPGLAMPVDLRIQVRGYEDEVFTIAAANLPAGSQGSYRIDVDFLLNNAVRTSIYNPTTNNIAGLFDNMKRRDVMLAVAGDDLRTGNGVTAMINLPYDDDANSATPVAPEFVSGGNLTNISGAANLPVYVTFPGVAVGYDLYYSVGVYGSASGSYNVSNTTGIMINPEVQPGNTTLVVGVNAKRPTS